MILLYPQNVKEKTVNKTSDEFISEMHILKTTTKGLILKKWLMEDIWKISLVRK